MKVNKINIIISVILAITMIMGVSFYTGAANVSMAQTSSNSDAQVLAADFDIAGTTLEPRSVLPKSYSSKDKGYITDVRAQKYNTCWAYGSLAAFETVINRRGNNIPNFSAMHMNYWGTVRKDGTGWLRHYDDGGYSYISMGYLTSWTGPRFESDFPDALEYDDFKEVNEMAPKFAGVNSVIYLDAQDRNTIKTAIYEYGAVIGNYSCEDDKFLNTKTYAYNCNVPGYATNELVGHCIAIVGWDDNYSKDNFKAGTKPKQNGAWFVKNSWGKKWGLDGYFWISYEDMYLFDTRFGYSYAINEYQRINTESKLYQNGVDGATFEFTYITNMDSLVYINIFDIEEGFNIIDKVNFETTSQGADYTLYHIPLDDNDSPVTDQSQWTVMGSGTIEYRGYYSDNIDEYTMPTGKNAIGVKIDKVGDSDNGIGVAEWLADGDNNFIFLPQSQHGKSYIMYPQGMEKPDGTLPWVAQDVMDFYSQYLNDEIGGTFVIKAVAKSDYVLGDADLDGYVTIIDATVLQRYLAMLSDFNDKQMLAADIDRDNKITILDATRIQRNLAGLK